VKIAKVPLTLLLIAIALVFVVGTDLMFHRRVAFRDDFDGGAVSSLWIKTLKDGTLNQSNGAITVEAGKRGSVSLVSEIVFTGSKFSVLYRFLPTVLPRPDAGISGAVSAVAGFALGVAYIEGDWFFSYWEANTRYWASTGIRASQGNWYVVRWIVSPNQITITVHDDKTGVELGSCVVGFRTKQTTSVTLATYSWNEEKISATWDYMEISLDPTDYRWTFLVVASAIFALDIILAVSWMRSHRVCDNKDSVVKDRDNIANAVCDYVQRGIC